MRVCALELCYQHEFACHKGRESLFLILHRCVLDTRLPWCQRTCSENHLAIIFCVNQTCFHHVRCSNHKASCHFTVNRDSWRSCSFAVCHVHVISHDFLSVAKHLSSLYAPGQNEVGATLEIAGDGSKIDYQWAQQIDHL